MLGFILVGIMFSSSQPRDTVRIVIDSIGSHDRIHLIGDSAEINLAIKLTPILQKIANKLDEISRENECDDFSSDTLDLRIQTENTKSPKSRWVRSGPIYPYGEERIRELMKLTSDLNPMLHPKKIYTIQYLKYCKSKGSARNELIKKI